MDLSDFFKTRTQAYDFSTRLAAISESIYQTDFNLEKTLMEQLGIKKSDKFMTFLRDNKVDTESPAALKEFLNKIKNTITALPTLSLTLAFEPREQTLQALAEWFILQTKTQVLFDITVDPKLIAGAAINFKGKYLDFSIKPTFDKILSETTTK